MTYEVMRADVVQKRLEKLHIQDGFNVDSLWLGYCTQFAWGDGLIQIILTQKGRHARVNHAVNIYRHA